MILNLLFKVCNTKLPFCVCVWLLDDSQHHIMGKPTMLCLAVLQRTSTTSTKPLEPGERLQDWSLWWFPNKFVKCCKIWHHEARHNNKPRIWKKMVGKVSFVKIGPICIMLVRGIQFLLACCCSVDFHAGRPTNCTTGKAPASVHISHFNKEENMFHLQLSMGTYGSECFTFIQNMLF